MADEESYRRVSRSGFQDLTDHLNAPPIRESGAEVASHIQTLLEAEEGDDAIQVKGAELRRLADSTAKRASVSKPQTASAIAALSQPDATPDASPDDDGSPDDDEPPKQRRKAKANG